MSTRVLSEKKVAKLRRVGKIKDASGKNLLPTKPKSGKSALSPDEKLAKANENLARTVLHATETYAAGVKVLMQAIGSINARPPDVVVPEVVIPEPAKEWEFVIKEGYGEKIITAKRVR